MVTHAFHNHGVRTETPRDDTEAVTDPSFLASNVLQEEMVVLEENAKTTTWTNLKKKYAQPFT